MSGPRETELKLAVDAADVARLRQRLRRFGRPTVEPLETVYYDSADFALAKQGIALRVRRAGKRWLQTLKTLGAQTALARRGEWEMPAPRGRLDLARFAGTPLATLLRARPKLKIEPRFRTRFTRALWTSADRAVEIALDRGEIVAGARATPICELELELKAGDVAALWPLALELVGTGKAALALLPYGESKAARGVAHASGRSTQPVKANAKAFAPGLAKCDTAGAALCSIIGTGTSILLANAHALRADDDPEFVHQARVAVRRMRSAIRLFEGEVEFPARLARELRWIGRALGEARDWDVFALHTVPEGLAESDQRRDLLARADAARRRARARAGAALGSARFARLALRLLQWSEDVGRDGGPSLHSLAGTLLPRAQRKIVVAARRFKDMTPAKQHRVRILVKRLRYALDLLSSRLPARPAASYLRHLSRLQDQLGALNDARVGQALLAACATPAASFADLRRRLRAVERDQVRAVDDALHALVPIELPWAALRGR